MRIDHDPIRRRCEVVAPDYLIIQDEAGVPHDSLPERSVELAERNAQDAAAARDDATRARYEELKDKIKRGLRRASVAFKGKQG